MKTLETPLTWILVPLCLSLFYFSKISAEELRAERIKQAEIEAAEKMRAEARALLIAERTITVEVIHDSDPATTTYPVIISAANSFDPEGDEFTFFWKQSDGVFVDLKETANTSEAQFDAKAGTYEFVLSISDSYGETCVDTVIVDVQPEPNSCPTPVIRK